MAVAITRRHRETSAALKNCVLLARRLSMGEAETGEFTLPPGGGDPTCTECGKVLTFEGRLMASLERIEFLLATMAGMYDEDEPPETEAAPGDRVQ